MNSNFNKITTGFLTAALLFGLATPVIAQDKPVDLEHLKFTLAEAPDWTNLFIRTSGWFGADGIYALPSDGARQKGGRPSSKNMFIFSDTMVGEINDGKLGENKMVHNSVACFKGAEPKNKDITFHWADGKDGKPESVFIPNTPSSEKQDYYWLGDGFVNTANGKTYIFGYRMRNLDTKNDWSFRQFATNLIIIPKGSKPPFKDQQQVETPFQYKDNKGSYGVSIFVNTKKAGAKSPDGYVYIYGTRAGGKLVVARILPADFENFSAWRFWDGAAWNADMEKAAGITTGVPNEASFSQLPDGRYAVVYQLGAMGTTVALRLAASPVGPFGPPIDLYHSTITNSKYIHYNAKAHPSLSSPGELLITYNQNAFDFVNQIALNPNLYHPYFLRLKFQ